MTALDHPATPAGADPPGRSATDPPAPARRPTGRGTLLAPLAGTLAVVWLELAVAGRRSLWLDEAVSVAITAQPLSGMARQLLTDEANMGPYYVLLWVWQRLGEGDVWLRSLSGVGTVVALWAVWALLRRHAGPAAAAGAVVVFLANPHVLSWTVQARAFTFAMAAVAVAALLADDVRRGVGGWGRTVGLGVSVGLGCALVLSSGLALLGVLAVTLALAPTRAVLVRLATAGVVAIVAFAPFAPAFATNRDQVGWIPELTSEGFRREALEGLGGWWPIALAALGALVLVARAAAHAELRPLLVAPVGLATALLGLVVVSLAVQPLFIARYLAPAAPLLAIAAVGGLGGLRRPAGRTAVAAVGLLAVVAVATGPGVREVLFEEDFARAAALIDAGARPDDGVAAVPGFIRWGLLRYRPGEVGIVAPRPQGGSRPPQVGLIATDDEPPRLWVLSRPSDAEHPAVAPAEAWLERAYPSVVERHEVDGLVVELRLPSG